MRSILEEGFGPSPRRTSMSAFVMGVAAGAGRGKTHLTRALMERFAAHLTVLYQDN